MTKASVVVEIDGPRNQVVMFRPWDKRVRGRLDIPRMQDVGSSRLMNEYPQGIPGQQILVDLATSTGAIIEPLHEDRYRAIREKIEGTGQKLPPEREVIENIDTTTCLWWLKQLVDAGKARLLQGEFPAIDESKVQRRFHSAYQPDATDRLVAAIEKQAEAQAEQNRLMARILDQLGSKKNEG